MEYLVQFHQMAAGTVTHGNGPPVEIPPEPDPIAATPLFAHMANKKDIPPGDIQRVLSQSMAKGATSRKSLVQNLPDFVPILPGYPRIPSNVPLPVPPSIPGCP